jgi:GNAT superfamily N-acetyltransferase
MVGRYGGVGRRVLRPSPSDCAGGGNVFGSHVVRSDTILLRPPEPRDAAALSALLAELGHPASPEDVVRRLARLRESDPDGYAGVVEADARAVGFVAAHLTPMLHRERPVVRVTTLVVGADYRGQGIGSFLLGAVEVWSLARGASRIELTSADAREEAHSFYEKRGFRREGVRFVREHG